LSPHLRATRSTGRSRGLSTAAVEPAPESRRADEALDQALALPGDGAALEDV
jgi:hypothetical protein